MKTLYKVTGASINRKANGTNLFKLHLNGSFFAEKKFDRFCRLYKAYIKNNDNINFLIGKYIAAYIREEGFRKEILSISSIDAIASFKSLLDKSNGKAFFTDINMFAFLERAGYPIDENGSIQLKGEYSKYSIKLQGDFVVCYPNSPEINTLTLENIELIYDHFFKGKYIETNNDDRAEVYVLTPTSIAIQFTHYDKSSSKTVASGCDDVLTVGDKLTSEQIQLLAGQ